jgi:signal transduction histidine kinase
LIFERFYKADTARKASGGSGLGLSIVHRIVDLHRGTMQLDPPPTGVGLQVTVALPRVRDERV